MKIAIPLDENKKDVCSAFARAPYFLFAQEGGSVILENPAASVQGGAGLRAAQFLMDQQTNALITVRCGQNAADVFKAAEIKIYKAEGLDAQENLTACLAGTLPELTRFHAGFQGVQ